MLAFGRRWGFRLSLSLVLLGLLGADSAAMIYRPSVGRFKDGFILWHQGQYYLFSMYNTTNDDANDHFRNVWLATSRDGVHWKDVGPVIKDAPFNIWAMAVHQVGDRFIMNHGSFSRPNVQNVIRFWESRDLVHWTFLGHDADLRPDARWYPPDSRLDCMNVLPVVTEGRTKYYGFATGPGGFLESDDGIHWSGKPQPTIDWGAVPPPPTLPEEGLFEIGGCHQIQGKYYLLGGWFNYMSSPGYGVYTLIADRPTGPFRPDAAAYRLCGNSARWVALWARFCPTNDDLLVNGYMYTGYSYETGDTWLPPLKRAIVDADGHLRLAYWQGNEALKATPLDTDLSTCQKTYPAQSGGECTCTATTDRLTLQALPERGSTLWSDLRTTVAMFPRNLDYHKGVVIEGTIQATCRNPRVVAPSVGFYLEEKTGEGTAILLHSYGKTEIGKMTLADRVDFRVEDTIGPGCAAPAGITSHHDHSFRLLIRQNMFELYLDDRFVQGFNTTHDPGSIGLVPQRLGFVAENGEGRIEHLKVWSMSLGE